MYRLANRYLWHIPAFLALLIGLSIASCAQEKPIIRDQLDVEQLRLRITKVRHAVSETRAVIASARGAPYLPELHMRLAELLSEEARYHYMVAYEREQKNTKTLHVPQVRFLKEQAISIYELILKRFPETHLADRILFNISHEHRELGEFDKMKKTLQKLVKEHPSSPYRSEASLVLGDFHFDKLQFGQAANHYQNIVKAKDDPLLGLALYKLGWVDVNQANCKQALWHFEKAIHAAQKAQTRAFNGKEQKKRIPAKLEGDFAIPDSEDGEHSFAGHKSLDVQREALVDLTYCYAQERKPEKAVAYLRKLSSSREAYVAALTKMANRYALIEQPVGAADVARELLRLAPNEEERLDDARMLHNAVVRMKDYTNVGEDVSLILRAMRRQILRPNMSPASVKLMRSEFELIARDLATRSHEVLTASQTKGKKLSGKAAATQTSLAYKHYLKAVPDSTHTLEVTQNLADVLEESGQHLEAGHYFRQSALQLKKPPREHAVAADATDNKKTTDAPKVDPKKAAAARFADRMDALYNAVVSYQTSLESIAVRSHFERSTARAGLRQAGGEYLREGNPAPERAKRIKFAIAQSFYDEGNYIEAIDLLTAVAYEYPKEEQGVAAVHMVLDSYQTINDISGLINAGRRFLSPESPVSDDLKAQVKPIVIAAEQNRLDELSLAASGEQVGGMEILLAFAERYKDTDLGERAMLSAFVAARAGGNANQLYQLGDAVMKQFPESDQVGGVISTMGQAAMSRFEFNHAIDYLEQAARLNPDQRATLLITAGELREQLADREGALKNYREALNSEGEGIGSFDATTHLANLVERSESPAEVVKVLTPLADSSNPEVSARLGLALLRTGQTDESEEYFRNVVEGTMGASSAAQARANYGMAEIMLKMLEEYEPPQDIDAIEELIGIVEVVLQSYLSAARQADPVFSQAALARLARSTEIAAEKLDTLSLPSGLTAEEKTLVQTAITNRAIQLRADRNEILAECAQRAKTSFLLDEAGIACIQGTPPKQDPVRFYTLSPRKKNKTPQVEDARDRLSKNPEDLDALRRVGNAFLDAGDAHGARLVLARTVEAGGDSSDLNLLGVASFQSGDLLGALDAFKRAKDAGSGAAIRNLAMICTSLGLKELAAELSKEAPSGVRGRLIRSGSVPVAGGGQ